MSTTMVDGNSLQILGYIEKLCTEKFHFKTYSPVLDETKLTKTEQTADAVVNNNNNKKLLCNLR